MFSEKNEMMSWELWCKKRNLSDFSGYIFNIFCEPLLEYEAVQKGPKKTLKHFL
jgi:hypothetical protein